MQRTVRLPPLFFILGSTLVASVSGHVAGDTLAHSLSTIALSPALWVLDLFCPLLCALAGAAAYLVWRDGDEERSEALYWFFVQLGLFFLWRPLLLRHGLCWAALLTLTIQCLLTLYAMELFRKQNPFAARLLLPYFFFLLYLLYYTLGAAFLN